MIARLVAALIVMALALCALWAAENWGDERAPLLIDASFAPDPEGGAPLAIPDENALYTVCPTTTRNVPAVRKNLA